MAAVPPLRMLSTSARTSSRVIRPPPPVPTIWAAVRLCSRNSRRTAGVILASGSPLAGAAVRAGADAATGGATGGTDGTDAGTSAAGVDSSEPAGPRAGSLPAASVVEATWPDAAAAPAPSAAGASAEAPSSAVSMMAISAAFGTVAPSSTRISLRTPSNGDGTSALTLSVMTSRSGSYLATWSPGCLSHFPIVPSATLSPSWGIVTFATFAGPPGRRVSGVPRSVPHPVHPGRVLTPSRVSVTQRAASARIMHIHERCRARTDARHPTRRGPGGRRGGRPFRTARGRPRVRGDRRRDDDPGPIRPDEPAADGAPVPVHGPRRGRVRHRIGLHRGTRPVRAGTAVCWAARRRCCGDRPPVARPADRQRRSPPAALAHGLRDRIAVDDRVLDRRRRNLRRPPGEAGLPLVDGGRDRR